MSEHTNSPHLPEQHPEDEDLADSIALAGVAEALPQNLYDRVHALFLHEPDKDQDFDFPEYTGDPTGYVRSAQAEMLAVSQDTTRRYNSMLQDTYRDYPHRDRTASHLSWWYGHAEAKELPPAVKPYFSRTFEIVRQSSRALAIDMFRTQRSHTLQAVGTFPSEVDASKLTVAIVSDLEEKVGGIQYASPVTDYHALGSEDRRAVMLHIQNECETVYQLASLHSLQKDLPNIPYRVILRPAEQLREVIDAHVVPPRRALWAFFAIDKTFDELHQSAVAHEVQKQAKIRTHLEQLEQGNEVRLSADTEPLTVDQMRSRINMVLAGSVQYLHDSSAQMEADLSVLDWSSSKTDAAKQIVSKLPHARRSNLLAANVPIDEEEIARYIKDWTPQEIPLPTVRQLRFSVDLKSTGRPAVPASVDVLIFGRYQADGTLQFEKRLVNKAHGVKKARELADQSIEIATRIQARNASRPYRGFGSNSR